MLERLDNIIIMILNDLQKGNPIIQLKKDSEDQEYIDIFIEINRDFKLKFSYLAELEEIFGSDVSLVQPVGSRCNIIKTKIPLDSIKNYE